MCIHICGRACIHICGRILHDIVHLVPLAVICTLVAHALRLLVPLAAICTLFARALVLLFDGLHRVELELALAGPS